MRSKGRIQNIPVLNGAELWLTPTLLTIAKNLNMYVGWKSVLLWYAIGNWVRLN